MTDHRAATDHKALAESHLKAAYTIHSATALQHLHATLAVYHSNVALIEAADTQLAATLAQTAAMERIARQGLSTPVLGGRL